MEKKLPAYTKSGLLRIWDTIPQSAKLTFLCAIITGLAANLTFMTGMMFNHDSFGLVYHKGFAGDVSGRWFTKYVFPFFLGDYSVPFVAGISRIILTAFSAAITVLILNFKNYLSCILTGLLLAVFPTIASENFYIWYIPVYGCALLFATLGVYLTVRFKYGFLSGCLFAFSLGLYQSYISFAIGLYTLYFVFILLDNKYIAKEIWTLILRTFISLIIGFTLYWILVKVTLAISSIELTTYQGLDTMGKIRPRTGIKNALNAFIAFFFKGNPNIGTDTSLIKFLTIISAIMICVIIAKQKLYKIKNLFNFIFLIFLTLTLPITLNTIYIFASNENTSISTTMIYSYILYPVFFIGLIEIYGNISVLCKPPINAIGAVACYVAAAIIFIIGYKYFQATNLIYMRTTLIQKQAIEYISTLTDNIMKTEGYVPGAKIIGYGELPATLMKNNLNDGLDIRGTAPNVALYLYNDNYRSGVQKYFLGLPITPITFITNDEAAVYPELADMPTYPHSGSIKVNDAGEVIIKFGE